MATTKTRLALAGLVCLLAIPAGYALAASEDDSAPAVGSETDAATEERLAGLEQGPLPDDPESAETDYAIEGPQSDSTVSACREDPRSMGSDPLMCEMAIGVADGTIEPGSFTEEQLREDLEN